MSTVENMSAIVDVYFSLVFYFVKIMFPILICDLAMFFSCIFIRYMLDLKRHCRPIGVYNIEVS